jgi:ABC-2 type transport system ATP-binding protein
LGAVAVLFFCPFGFEEFAVNGPAVEITGVGKTFRRRERGAGTPWWHRGITDKVALHPLDLTVPAGGVTGVLGPNGSGKSTLIRILGTLLTPDAGTARVFGWDVVKDALEVRRHINRVSVEAAFFKELSAWENMLYAARLYGSESGRTRSRVVEVLSRLGLPVEAVDQPMKQLSRGQQQKVAIARSFLTSPSLLLMDEPTTGLDPRSKREVQSVLETLRAERDVTVLLCTHDMDEASALCERVLLMDGGRLLADGSPEDLRREHGGGTLEDVFMHLTGKTLEAEEPAEVSS